MSGFLTAHEAAVVEAATARLIPGPADDPLEVGSPGAREANVVGYIDTLLSAFDHDPPRIYPGGPFSGRHGGADGLGTFQPLTELQDRWWRARIAELQSAYRDGVATLDAATPGSDFATATPDEQDDALTEDTTGFRDLLFEHAVEGWLADPVYGGNAGSAGWVAVAFPGDACPDGYTDAEVSGGDGPDPVDTSGIVGSLLDLIGGVWGA